MKRDELRGERMRRVVRVHLFLCGLLCMGVLLNDVSFASQQKVTWLNFGQIPMYIDKGEYKGKGIVENIIQFLHREHLSEYGIQYQEVNHKRFDIVAREGDNCYFGWQTYPEQRLFSRPFSIWFPMGLIAHKKNQQKFGDTATIHSLAQLLKEGELTLGVIDGFAYNQEVRLLLAQYEGQEHLKSINTKKMQIELSMLEKRPIDYIIGWPFQPKVWEKLRRVPNEYLFYNIEEDQNYLYLGVSCSDSPTGRDVVDTVNQLVDDRQFLQTIQGFIAEWLVLSEQHQSLYDQTIIKRQPHPLVQDMVYQ